MIYTVFPVDDKGYCPCDFPTMAEAKEHQEWLDVFCGCKSVIQITTGDCE